MTSPKHWVRPDGRHYWACQPCVRAAQNAERKRAAENPNPPYTDEHRVWDRAAMARDWQRDLRRWEAPHV